MDKTNCLISIIVVIYNKEGYIRDCFKSISRQTFDDFEVIIIDDGSTDNSLKIEQEYEKNDGRFKVFPSDKNNGTLIARKKGIQFAQGKYTVFIDPDDVFAREDSLQIMYFLITKHNVDVLQFEIECIQSDGKKTDNTWFKVYDKKIEGGVKILEACIDNKYNWALWNKIYKTECLKKACVYIYDAYIVTAEDCYLYFFIALNSFSFIGIKSEALYKYTVDSGITSYSDLNLKKFESFCRENLIISWIKISLKQSGEKNINNQYKQLLAKLSKRFLEHSLYRYRQINCEFREDAKKIFLKYFGKYEIFEYMNNENKELKEAVAMIKRFNIKLYFMSYIYSKLMFGNIRKKYMKIFREQSGIYKKLKMRAL